MITGGKHELQPAITPEAICGAFSEHQEELRWLAAFLTGDDGMGEACVFDACACMQKSCDGGADRLTASPAFATVNSAIQVQQSGIAELAPVYANRVCSGRTDEKLAAESLEFIVLESDVIRSRLDTICRFVLVICGIENRAPTEAASWLSISRSAVEAAYCAAIDSLEVIDCQRQIESDPGSTAWN